MAQNPGDLAAFVQLCVSQVAPAQEGVELGIGDALLQKAVAQATGSDAKEVSTGDRIAIDTMVGGNGCLRASVQHWV